MDRNLKPLTENQKAMLRRRGIDYKHFRVLKELNFALFLVDIRDSTIKIIDRRT